MSTKTDQNRTIESQAVCNIKSKVLLNAKMDFKNPQQNERGEKYDLRLFYDSSDKKMYYPYVFSKTLNHNPVTGFPTKSSVDSMINAIRLGTKEGLDNIQQHPDSTRKLENVLASHSFNLVGSDSSIPYSDSKFVVDSESAVFEMCEVYGMSLHRDTTFWDLENLPSTDTVISTLNNFSDKSTASSPVTGKNLYRGTVGRDQEIGPYISQCLYLPSKHGNMNIEQKYEVELDYEPSVTFNEWLDVQNGKVSGQKNVSGIKYIHTPRVLGSIVHADPLYSIYFNAATVLFGQGINPVGYNHSKNSDWTSGGGPFVLSTIGAVALEALKTAWYQKFQVRLAIRPEVYAQRIDLAFGETDNAYTNHVPGRGNIKSLVTSKASGLMSAISQANSQNGGTYLLKAQYPEQSPTHASDPQGHSSVAGACCTLLKALLQTHDVGGGRLAWPSDVVHSVNGDSLEAYPGSTSNMTIVGEINKLAYNCSAGRDFAGVHYRGECDRGLLLGEQVAISYLENMFLSIHEGATGLLKPWILEKFSGEVISIGGK